MITIFLLLSSASHASASHDSQYASTIVPAQLPRTGQTTCYDTAGVVIPCAGTGQDGEIQAGVSWPDPRFTDQGDGTVTDNLTGLMWAKDANLITSRDPWFDVDGTLGDGEVTWQHALDYVAKLNAEAYLGYSDWRLPNINGLESLIDFGIRFFGPALPIDNPFTNVRYDFFCCGWPIWSSTTMNSSDNSDAWIVYMDDGLMFGIGKSVSMNYVWSVRPAQNGIIQLPKTGQTTSYATGDDGALQKGMAWPTPRFTDHSNDTVTDNLTGLMWTKDANLPGNSMPWQQALDYVAGMNAGIYPNFAYTDWRLPNQRELKSLIDYGRSNPALSFGHPFTNTESYYYHWSSTSYLLSGYALILVINSGRGSNDIKFESEYGHVWPVRGGHIEPQGPQERLISGVATQNGSPLPGVTMILGSSLGDLPATTTTEADGTYSFAVPNGDFTIAPDMNGYIFNPVNRSVTVAGLDVTGVDFTATVVSVDADGDGYLSNQDCDDTNPAIHPGATEICNGIDDNCNGQADETWSDLNNICAVGVGACEFIGNRVCSADGSGTVCSAIPGSPSAEICDGFDNDCDGVVDNIGNKLTYSGPLSISADSIICQGENRYVASGNVRINDFLYVPDNILMVLSHFKWVTNSPLP